MKQLPKNQSSATRTARALEAIEADLMVACAALGKAAALYRTGEFEGGAAMLSGIKSHIDMPLQLLRSIK